MRILVWFDGAILNGLKTLRRLQEQFVHPRQMIARNSQGQEQLGASLLALDLLLTPGEVARHPPGAKAQSYAQQNQTGKDSG